MKEEAHGDKDGDAPTAPAAEDELAVYDDADDDDDDSSSQSSGKGSGSDECVCCPVICDRCAVHAVVASCVDSPPLRTTRPAPSPFPVPLALL